MTNPNYNRVIAAKAGVEALLSRFRKDATPLEMLDYIHDNFNEIEKIVVSNGYFIKKDGEMLFQMPSTQKVLEKMETTDAEKFKTDFTKIVIKTRLAYDSDHTVLSYEVYYWNQKK